MAKKMSIHEWQAKQKMIEWDEKTMATGVPEVDNQHKEWISRFNEFEKAIVINNGEQACSDTLLFFLRYTDTHFRFEENIMDLYHCPARYVNKQEHQRFKAWIEELVYKTWPLGALPEDVVKLEQEMVDWLKNHICTVDVKLRESV